jgi:hypothetical protein
MRKGNRVTSALWHGKKGPATASWDWWYGWSVAVTGNLMSHLADRDQNMLRKIGNFLHAVVENGLR